MKMTICIIRTTGRHLLERAYDWAKKFLSLLEAEIGFPEVKINPITTEHCKLLKIQLARVHFAGNVFVAS